jgi:DNA-binding response OmpR family regulator
MKKILIVDDEVEICGFLKEFLTEKNYIVAVAYDGASAINKAKKFIPHIVLLDIKMPGINGVTTLRKIKKIDPSIVVIMISAVYEEEIAKECVELGAFDYILKPFELNYLETVLLVKITELMVDNEY